MKACFVLDIAETLKNELHIYYYEMYYDCFLRVVFRAFLIFKLKPFSAANARFNKGVRGIDHLGIKINKFHYLSIFRIWVYDVNLELRDFNDY